MLNLFSKRMRQIHQGELIVFIGVGGVLVHEARLLFRTFDLGIGLSAWTDLTWWQITGSGLDYILMGGILLVGGIALVTMADARTQKESREESPEILKRVLAAAAGDMSGVPETWASGAAGPLAQAVSRLIGVLERSENLVYHQSALIDSSGEAIVSCSLEGTILSWNKGAQRIFGYSSQEMKGRSITLLSPKDEGTQIAQLLAKVRNDERIQPFETVYQASNGRTVKSLVWITAVLDSTRQAIGVSFCAQELTDSRQGRSQTTATAGQELR